MLEVVDSKSYYHKNLNCYQSKYSQMNIWRKHLHQDGSIQLWLVMQWYWPGHLLVLALYSIL